MEFARTFDRKADTKQVDSMRYRDGAVAFFRLRPHEVMEYTRFPQPGDDRYPPPQGLRILSDPGAIARVIWGNLQWSFQEFQRVTLVGFLALMVILVGVALGRISLTAPTVLLGVISGAVLGLHFLGPVREARLLGPVFLLALPGPGRLHLVAGIFSDSRGDLKKLAAPGSVVAGLFCFQVLYPQYFREVPRRWQQHLLPHASQLAADYILRTQGPGAVVSSREPEAAYRCRGFWIAQPDGSAGDRGVALPGPGRLPFAPQQDAR